MWNQLLQSSCRHKKLTYTLEQSNVWTHDHTDQLLTDLAEARKKKKKRHDSPKTPPGSHLSQITGIGIRALSYRELGCISNMSNSDELRHTDNTTLVPPRLPDTLLQVYHRRRPTLGLLILPPVSPFPPTIRRTARISVLPIEPNLAERARISAINLDDYQLDPLTPPPSPLSLFSMAAYQRMTAETDPTQREEALTVYGMETGQSSVPIPETTLIDVKPRVEESLLETLYVDELITQLRQVCKDAEDRASNAQEVPFPFLSSLVLWNDFSSLHMVVLTNRSSSLKIS
ncbi:hypothetical protein Tco_0835154 [Tanacetum coccineum]